MNASETTAYGPIPTLSLEADAGVRIIVSTSVRTACPSWNTAVGRYLVSLAEGADGTWTVRSVYGDESTEPCTFHGWDNCGICGGAK